MSQSEGPVEGFVDRVRARLNRHRLWTTAIWTVVAAAAVLVAIGLWYTLRGYAVPGAAIIATAALAAIGGLLAWRLRLFSRDGAALTSDRHYKLHDAIGSYLHFARAGRNDGFYALQAEQTRTRVEPLDPQEIKYQPPRRGMALAACLVAFAVPLSLRGPSDEVLREQQIQAQTAEATALINEQLAKSVDELREEAIDPNEKEMLDPDKLRQWVDELKQTTDQKEALRQYAELERKLNEARLAVQNKRDEQLLERAARELEQSRETQPLAEQLEQKNYDKAAEQLEKMSPQQKSTPLDKQRQELARLTAAAQHMDAAARASSANASQSKSESKSSKSKSGAGSKSSGGSGSGSDGGGEMSETMEDLAEAVADMDDALKDAERQEKEQGECDADTKKKCESCQQCVSSIVSKLKRQLKKLSMCKKCESKLSKLCKQCSQCQGMCNSMCQSPNAGGKKAGSGTNTARRSERDELVDNGQTTQLKGTKGTGPSLTTVESAEDGSGVSHRKASAQERKFQRQFEAFVSREDVPEQVKRGVKHYFEVIHEIQPEAKSEKRDGGS
jgi:hypothetical protein